MHVVLLSKHFNNEQFETVLVAGQESAGEGSMSSFVEEHGINPLFIPYLQREISLLQDLKAFITLWRLLRKHKPDIVHTHTSKAGLLGRLAAKLSGVQVIIHTYHGNIFDHYFGSVKTALFIWIERILSLFSNAVVAISESQAAELKSYGIGRGKVKIIPLGFDFKRVDQASDSCLLRERYGLGDNNKLIGTVGRLVPIKNHILFLKTAEELLQQRDDLYFFLVGDGELRSSLEKEVRRLGLEERVFFTGWVEDMAAVYQELDLLLLTSLNEGTPLTAIEAMAAGCAVVSTDVGGVSDVITEKETGLLASSGDHQGLARQVLWFLEHPDEAHRMVERARQKALENYYAARLFSDLEKLYSQLIKAKNVNAD